MAAAAAAANAVLLDLDSQLVIDFERRGLCPFFGGGEFGFGFGSVLVVVVVVGLRRMKRFVGVLVVGFVGVDW